MGIKQGGSYGVSKTVHARFPLTADQFNALKNSLASTLKFTLSVNKYISPDGAAGVVAAVDGSKLKDVTWVATGQGTSSELYPLCDNIIGPKPGTTAVSGYENDQTLAGVCLTTNVQSIADNAFSTNDGATTSSLSSIYVPSSVTSIGQDAFALTKLKRVIFTGDIQIIGQRAFRHASFDANIHLALTFPGAVGSIEVGAFDSFQVSSLSFGGTVESIGAGAFYNNNLETVTFPVGLTSIGDSAFYGNQLTSVTFLGAVGSIGPGVFSSNPAFTVYYPSSWTSLPTDKFPTGTTFVSQP